MRREDLKKTANEINNLGSRLFWIRNKLNLKSVDVCKATNIPTSSYCDREAGLRTCFYEEMLVLSLYFNQKWQKKFSGFNSYPSYKGNKVDEVSFSWLLLGFDKTKEDYEEIIDNIRDNYLEREKQLNDREMELRNQLNMLDII